MIQFADLALISWLSTIDPSPAVVVGPPCDAVDRARSAAPNEGAVHLELLAIREQTQLRGSVVEDIRNEDGIVIAQQRGRRWFALEYRCTVSGDPVDAHRVLGAVVQLLVDHGVVPTVHVPDDLARLGEVRVGFVDHAAADGGLVIRAVVPVRPNPEPVTAPAVTDPQFVVGRLPPASGVDGPGSMTGAPMSQRRWSRFVARETAGGPPAAAAGEGR